MNFIWYILNNNITAIASIAKVTGKTVTCLSKQNLFSAVSMPVSCDGITCCHIHIFIEYVGLLGGAMVKNSPANAGDTRNKSSVSGSGRSPGKGNGNPLQYSCLENTMDRRG